MKLKDCKKYFVDDDEILSTGEIVGSWFVIVLLAPFILTILAVCYLVCKRSEQHKIPRDLAGWFTLGSVIWVLFVLSLLI